MVSPRSARFGLRLGSQLATTTTCYAVAGMAGKIVGITVGVPALPTTATLVISKGSTALHDSIAIETALVAGTAEEVTLTATAQELDIAVGDILKAVWTVTDAGGTFVGGDAVVWIEPNTW